MEGLEPSTNRVSGDYSNQLSYIPWFGLLDIFKSPPWADATRFKYFIVGFEPTPSPTFATAVLVPTFPKVFAPLAGFEPTTLELTALCSTAELKGNKLHSVRESNPMSMRGFGGLPLP